MAGNLSGVPGRGMATRIKKVPAKRALVPLDGGLRGKDRFSKTDLESENQTHIRRDGRY